MADKPKKKRAAKARKEEPGVLAALPAQRPTPIGAQRAAAPKTFEPTAAAGGDAPSPRESAGTGNGPAKPPAAKRRATAKRAAKPKAAAKPRATAARRKAAAPRTFEPTAAAEAAAGAADERSAGAPVPPPRPAAGSYPRPRPVREGAPGIGTTGHREERPSTSRRPSGSELASNAVKAAGELAQVGLTIGGQLLKRALDRVPRP